MRITTVFDIVQTLRYLPFLGGFTHRVSLLVFAFSIGAFSAPVPKRIGVRYAEKIFCPFERPEKDITLYTHLETLKADAVLPTPKGEPHTVWDSNRENGPAPKPGEFANGWDTFFADIDSRRFRYQVEDFDDSFRSFHIKTEEIAIRADERSQELEVTVEYITERQNPKSDRFLKCWATY